MTWSSGWRLAVGTLTVLPVRPPSNLDAQVAGRAMALAPVAVLPVAAVVAGLGWLLHLSDGPGLLSGLVVVAGLALGTRALHLDGLADTVDGWGSGRDRTRALDIMRRGDIGPMGVIALVLVLGGQAVCAAELSTDWPDAVLLTVLIAASRAALLIACRTGVPAARPDGLGATVAGTVSPAVAVLLGSVVAVAVVIAVVAAGRPWWAGAAAVALAVVVAIATVGHAVRRFGGITGDVLGATVELTLTALLVGVTVG